MSYLPRLHCLRLQEVQVRGGGEVSNDPTALPVTSLTTMTPFAGQKSAHQVPRQ